MPKLVDADRVVVEVNKAINRNAFRPGDTFAAKRNAFSIKIKKLETVAIACELWSLGYIGSILDHTNDRIYNQL